MGSRKAITKGQLIPTSFDLDLVAGGCTGPMGVTHLPCGDEVRVAYTLCYGARQRCNILSYGVRPVV